MDRMNKNKLTEVSIYNVNMWKFFTFVYTNNKKSEEEP